MSLSPLGRSCLQEQVVVRRRLPQLIQVNDRYLPARPQVCGHAYKAPGLRRPSSNPRPSGCCLMVGGSWGPSVSAIVPPHQTLVAMVILTGKKAAYTHVLTAPCAPHKQSSRVASFRLTLSDSAACSVRKGDRQRQSSKCQTHSFLLVQPSEAV